MILIREIQIAGILKTGPMLRRRELLTILVLRLVPPKLYLNFKRVNSSIKFRVRFLKSLLLLLLLPQPLLQKHILLLPFPQTLRNLPNLPLQLRIFPFQIRPVVNQLIYLRLQIIIVRLQRSLSHQQLLYLSNKDIIHSFRRFQAWLFCKRLLWLELLDLLFQLLVQERLVLEILLRFPE